MKIGVEKRLMDSKKYPTLAHLIDESLNQGKTVELSKADYGFHLVVDGVEITTDEEGGVFTPELFDGIPLYKRRRSRRYSFVERLTEEAKNKIREIDSEGDV